MKTLFITTFATLIVAAPVAGLALNPRSLQPNEHPTNLPGVTTIEAPPAGFEPVNASDEELAYHGFPPRPDQNAEPKAFTAWARAMNASKTRLVPQLEQTVIVHGPTGATQKDGPGAVTPKTPPLHDNTISSFLSGYFAQSGATIYGPNSFYYIVTDFVVPVAAQVGCNGTWADASEWVGLDGMSTASTDVLQAGVEFDAYCSGATKATYYSAWYEWYPYGEVRIPSLPVTAGDDVFVEVWHTSATQGYAYIVNLDTNQYVDLGFTAYPGHSLVGDTAEWIVEDPGALVNFAAIPFWHGYAYTQSNIQYCSTAGTPVLEQVLPITIKPIPIGSCSFVDIF